MDDLFALVTVGAVVLSFATGVLVGMVSERSLQEKMEKKREFIKSIMEVGR